MTIKSFNSVAFTSAINDAIAKAAESKEFGNALNKASKLADAANLGTLKEYAPNLIGYEGMTWAKYVMPIVSIIVGETEAKKAGQSVEGVIALVGDTQLYAPGMYGYTRMATNPLYQPAIMQGDKVLKEAVGEPRCKQLLPVTKFNITEYVKCVYEAKVCPCCTSREEFKKLQEAHKALEELTAALNAERKDAIAAGMATLWTKKRDLLKKRIESAKVSLSQAEDKLETAKASKKQTSIDAAQKRYDLAKQKLSEVEVMLHTHLNTNIDGTPMDDASPVVQEAPAEEARTLTYEELKTMSKDAEVTLESLLAEAQHLSKKEQSTLKSMWTKNHKA